MVTLTPLVFFDWGHIQNLTKTGKGQEVTWPISCKKRKDILNDFVVQMRAALPGPTYLQIKQIHYLQEFIILSVKKFIIY